MTLDFALVERWETGRSLARGLPRPVHDDGGLRVDVGSPGEMRRHVFLDAGAALQRCAARNDAPHFVLKAAVAPQAMRSALPPRWTIDDPGYLMIGPPHGGEKAELPSGYSISVVNEHGGQMVRVLAGAALAAAGRVSVHAGCAVFDQILTEAAHRRRGLGTAVMQTLDALAQSAGATERLLVATAAGRLLYERLGWHVLAPWSTAVQRPATCAS
jgi:hypothetical protein